MTRACFTLACVVALLGCSSGTSVPGFHAANVPQSTHADQLTDQQLQTYCNDMHAWETDLAQRGIVKEFVCVTDAIDQDTAAQCTTRYDQCMADPNAVDVPNPDCAGWTTAIAAGCNVPVSDLQACVNAALGKMDDVVHAYTDCDHVDPPRDQYVLYRAERNIACNQLPKECDPLIPRFP